MLDFDDVVQRSMTVVRDGENDLAPTAGRGLGRPGGGPCGGGPGGTREGAKPPVSAGRGGSASSAWPRLALFLITAISPPALIGHLVVFALAIVIGYYVIGNVHHALHTPLMSVTNAISGIILVGALLQIGQPSLAVTLVATVGDPAGHHQRLRRFRGDPPHAGHVPTELTTMTAQSAASAAYIVAALLFILALAGLSRHETAPAGNMFGIAGMAIALVATLVLALEGGFTGLRLALLIVAMAVGAAIGLFRAARVPMTGMPELIALFHSFVGLAAVLVGWNGYLEVEAAALEASGRGSTPTLLGIHHAEVVIGVFIGAVTFTGSIVAWGKLSARFKSAPLVLPGKNALNLGALVAFAVLTVWFVIAPTLGVLIAVTVHRAGARRAPGRLDRRRRHARRRVHAQQLLRLGRGGRRASCSATTC